MSIRVLGTGAADGWPQAFCRCASCLAERAAGRVRSQTSALIDGAVLLDCGPGTPEAAVRAGVDLGGLRAVLFTHQHSDHCSPAALLHRHWVSAAPLTVAGPPDVVEACRPWLPADAAVTWVALAPGDELALDDVRVRALAAAHTTALGEPGAVESLLYDLTTADGLRVLYATDTGALPEATVAALAGARLDVLLIEETFGDRDDLAGTQHLGLAGLAEQLRRLRAVDAVTEATDVVAVHLSHHNPPAPELARRLAALGARVVDDGTDVDPRRAPTQTLVLGGARSGKSAEAERLLAEAPEVVYVATSGRRDGDAEWAERVAAHVERRPAGWSTVETVDLADLLATPGPPVLIDCLTLWLTAMIDRHAAWDRDDADWSRRWGEVEAEVERLVAAWSQRRRRVVAVSNEVGQGIVPASASGRLFRDAMGRVNAAAAAVCDDVRWCVAGRVSVL